MPGRGDARERADVPGQVRLVGVPGPGGDLGRGHAGPQQGDRPTEPQHPAQHRRPVAERGEAAAVQGAGGPAEVVRGLRGRATARQPPRGRAQPGFGRGTGEPGREGGEDRRGRCAGGQCRDAAPGECGVQRVQRNARVTQGRSRHVEQRGQNPGKEPQPARRDARPPLERVRRGVRPGDEQLRAGPDEVHAAVGQHVDHLGRGRRRRGPHALGEPAPPKRHGVLAVAHGTDGSAHAGARCAGTSERGVGYV